MADDNLEIILLIGHQIIEIRARNQIVLVLMGLVMFCINKSGANHTMI